MFLSLVPSLLFYYSVYTFIEVGGVLKVGTVVPEVIEGTGTIVMLMVPMVGKRVKWWTNEVSVWNTRVFHDLSLMFIK